MITFGAFGRLYLGGREEDIAQAARTAERAQKVRADRRANKGAA